MGRGRVTHDPDEGNAYCNVSTTIQLFCYQLSPTRMYTLGLDMITKMKCLGALKKQVFNRACEDAFSRIVLAVVHPGERLASVTLIKDGYEEQEPIICPKVNVLPASAYAEYSQTDNY